MKAKTLYKELNKVVQSSKIDPKMAGKPHVATLAGPAVVIEIIVRHAEKVTGIKMDWSYWGGRACIQADVKNEQERLKVRHELWLTCPQSDLTIDDCVAYLGN